MMVGDSLCGQVMARFCPDFEVAGGYAPNTRPPWSLGVVMEVGDSHSADVGAAAAGSDSMSRARAAGRDSSPRRYRGRKPALRMEAADEESRWMRRFCCMAASRDAPDRAFPTAAEAVMVVGR